jgi:hypothetical protein
LVIFDPDVYPMDLAWLTGKTSADHLRHTRPAYFLTLLRPQSPPQPSPAEPPQETAAPPAQQAAEARDAAEPSTARPTSHEPEGAADSAPPCDPPRKS